jgi:pimeloyl-ACP methyl ester carboxylesterase
MPKIKTSDGVNLYYEEAGAGTPVVFVHEFAGDYRTWEPQMRRFSRAYRCVTYSQRGYPPSDIPDDAARYGQDFARSDVISLIDALKIDRAHVVGHSMGAYTALHVGIKHPERCISVTAAGCGWGSLPDPAARAAMRAQAAETSKMFMEKDMAAAAVIYPDTPNPAHAKVQGSTRLRRIRQHARRAFGQGPRADHGDAAIKAADLVGHGSGPEEILGAASDHRRRRRRYLP